MLPTLPQPKSIQILLADEKWQKCEIRSILNEDDAKHYFSQRCRALLVNWTRDDGHIKEFFLAQDDKGRLTIGSHWRNTAPMSIKRHAHPPYSENDIFADSASIAGAMIPDGLSNVDLDVNLAIADAAEDFLSQIEPRALTLLRTRRNLTLSEHAFLYGNRNRMDAAMADPWLLPLLVCAKDIPDIDQIVEAIDTGEKLLPVMRAVLGIPLHVIRTLRKVASDFLPESNYRATRTDVRLDRVARCLALLPPEKHPIPAQWPQFLVLVRTLSTIWKQFGDTRQVGPLKERQENVVPPALIGKAWLGMLRSPSSMSFQDIGHDKTWLLDLSACIWRCHTHGGRLLYGDFGGHSRHCMPSEAWAVAYLLSHPKYLLTQENQWNRRLLLAREDFDAFFADTALPVAIQAALPLDSAGRFIEAIPTVHDLVSQSRKSNNCLPIYLDKIFRREMIIMAIKFADGALLGHAEIAYQDYENFYEPGAIRGKDNSELDEHTVRIVTDSLHDICLSLNNESDFNKVSEHDEENAKQAARVFAKAKIRLNGKAAARILDRAILCFRLGAPANDAHTILEIDWLMEQHDYFKAKAIVAERGARVQSAVRNGKLPEYVDDELTSVPLPRAADFPICLALQIAPYFSSDAFQQEDAVMFARRLLAENCLPFSSKVAIVNAGASLSIRQYDEIMLTLMSATDSLNGLCREGSVEILNVAASTILNGVLVPNWYGMHTTFAQDEALIRTIVRRAEHRGGLLQFLLAFPSTTWEEYPLSAYVWKYALPRSHPAWKLPNGFEPTATPQH